MRVFRIFMPYVAIAFTTAVLVSMTAQAQTQQGRSTMDREMELMDANQDGRITAAEHATGAHKMFETMDADQDGKVTAAEMSATHATMTKAQHGAQPPDAAEKSAADKIKAVDGNGDGVLTAAEHAAGAAHMFEKMDNDRDGALTAVELRAGYKYLRQANDRS